MTRATARSAVLVLVALLGLVPNGLAQAGAAAVPRVIGVEPERAGLEKRINLTVENLAAWQKENERTHDPRKLVPYLNGIALKGAYPEAILPTEGNRTVLRFNLRHTSLTREAWAALLGKPSFTPRQTPVSVGLETEFPLATDVKEADFSLIMIDPFWFWLCVLVILTALIAFLIFMRRSNIIRGWGPEPGDNKMKPYSLGRTQMAFWFFLVLASYLFIWVVTGDRQAITGSVLILLGISAATALGAVLVDASKQAAANAPPTPQTSQGFLIDILSDADGVSIHRFQIFVWTIVLGIIFIQSVYNVLAMPEFGETLLALMGISSGTYVGFKFPEHK